MITPFNGFVTITVYSLRLKISTRITLVENDWDFKKFSRVFCSAFHIKDKFWTVIIRRNSVTIHTILLHNKITDKARFAETSV